MVTAVTVTVYLQIIWLYPLFFVPLPSDMTREEIKKMVDDERAEQLTARLCRHWEVATQRLKGLIKELESDMDTCVEAEVYAALMRMQSSVTALMELNQMPCFYLFSEYLDRVRLTVSDTGIRQSVITLLDREMDNERVEPKTPFFDMVKESMTKHFELSTKEQKALQQKVIPSEQLFSLIAPYLKQEDMMMAFAILQELKTGEGEMTPDEMAATLTKMRQTMDDLTTTAGENLLIMLLWLMILMLLPSLYLSLMQKKREDSKQMAQLFNKVLMRVRESTEWWNYWNDYRQTLKVVNGDITLKEVMEAEASKERAELGKVRGGLFAKWTTDREAFDAYFLEPRLSDDELRHFIIHLTALYEIAREQNPGSKMGKEQIVRNDTQQVGDAVLQAAMKLQELTDQSWQDHYEPMWQELINNEKVLAKLKVTRKSPHNDQFTARFFCHLVGGMKKSAVFGSHSDHDLAKKLVAKNSVDTFRKNIQEGMDKESKELQNIFYSIYQKHNALAHPNR